MTDWALGPVWERILILKQKLGNSALLSLQPEQAKLHWRRVKLAWILHLVQCRNMHAAQLALSLDNPWYLDTRASKMMQRCREVLVSGSTEAPSTPPAATIAALLMAADTFLPIGIDLWTCCPRTYTRLWNKLVLKNPKHCKNHKTPKNPTPHTPNSCETSPQHLQHTKEFTEHLCPKCSQLHCSSQVVPLISWVWCIRNFVTTAWASFLRHYSNSLWDFSLSCFNGFPLLLLWAGFPFSSNRPFCCSPLPWHFYQPGDGFVFPFYYGTIWRLLITLLE